MRLILRVLDKYLQGYLESECLRTTREYLGRRFVSPPRGLKVSTLKNCRDLDDRSMVDVDGGRHFSALAIQV